MILVTIYTYNFKLMQESYVYQYVYDGNPDNIKSAIKEKHPDWEVTHDVDAYIAFEIEDYVTMTVEMNYIDGITLDSIIDKVDELSKGGR